MSDIATVSLALTPEQRVAKRLLRVAGEAPWTATKGQLHDVLDGWSVATQGHYLIAVGAEIAELRAEKAYPGMVDLARKFVAVPATGTPYEARDLRRWAVTPHCRTCTCRANPREGKLCGVLISRDYLARVLHCVKPLGDEPVLLAPNGTPDLVKDDPLCTAGTHVALFGRGWRALLMALRTAENFAEFGN